MGCLHNGGLGTRMGDFAHVQYVLNTLVKYTKNID